MARTLREIKEMLKQVDLVIETCDARFPHQPQSELLRLIRGKPSFWS
jgi:ribosome biogenesis GTPase A